jgi:DNA (cytosine-5)-methyltransferase 1
MSTPVVPLRYVSVCSGMEAASVAWHPLGWTPVGFSEIEPFPCAILKHRFPNVPNYGSLTEYQSWPLEQGAIDLLVGGTPCQSFSVAGLRKGLADPRGNLALTFLGLADKLKPKWIVWENVPGVLSSNGGRDFGSFVGALGQLGYGWAMRILDAQHFGVPQRRRRVFVVACLGDWRAAAEVLSLGEGLRGYLETGNKKRKGVAADAGASVEAIGLQRTVGTLCADTHPGAYSGQDAYTGRLIPAPTIGTLCARDYKGVGNQYVQEGKCIPCPAPLTYDMKQHHNPQPSENVQLTTNNCAFVRGDTPLVQPIAFRKSKRACSTTDNETWVPADASNTLNNFDLGDTRTTHAVVQPIAWTQNQREEVRLLGDKVGAIALPGTHQTNYIAEPKVYENHAQDSRVTGPLEVAPTVAAKFGTGGGNVPLVGAMAVRRLTPVECERLQGFPDNWSRISWKGKPEEECPDGPRYKACGNSMAVPVMRWIGERIAAYELSQNHETK